jgi:chromate transporter
MKGDKYTYHPKDKEMHLDEPLLEHSTHPSSAVASPRPKDEFTFSDTNPPVGQVMNMSMKLSMLAYEEVRRDRKKLKNESITNQNLITESQFGYLEELTENLPGHNTTQMILAISLIRTHSVMYSLLAVLIYYLPSLILTIILSQLDRYYNEMYANKVWSPRQNFFMFYLAVLILGVSQAVVGLIIHNGCILFHGRSEALFNMILMTVSAFLDSTNDRMWTKFLIMVVWGVLCMIRGEENKLKDKPTQAIASTQNISFLGKTAFYTFAGIFLFSIFLLEFYPHKATNTYLMASFFRIGTFTTTGGHSIIPLVLSEFGNNIGTIEILKGLSFVSLLPGPMFNLAAFIGGLLNGIISAIVSVIFIALPGILLLMAVLPYPEKLKYNSALRNFLIGVNLASIGFIFAAAFKLYKEVVFHNPYIDPISSTLNIVVCFSMLYSLYMSVPIVLLTGGAIAMIYSLVYTQLYV